MIDIDLSIALKNEGTTYSYEYNAIPDLGDDIDFKEPLKLRSKYCVDDKCVRVIRNARYRAWRTVRPVPERNGFCL